MADYRYSPATGRYHNVSSGRMVSDSTYSPPSLPLNDVSDGGFADVVETSHSAIFAARTRERTSNLLDLFSRQFRLTMMFAYLTHALIKHIGDVFGIRSGKQVTGTNARRVITVVTDEQAIFNGAVVERVRELMDTRSPLSPSTKGDIPIPICVGVARPDPAWPKFGLMDGDGAVLVDLGPETILNRYRQRQRAALVAAVGEGHARYRLAASSAWLGRLTPHRDHSSVSRPRMLTHRGGTYVAIIQHRPGVGHA